MHPFRAASIGHGCSYEVCLFVLFTRRSAVRNRSCYRERFCTLSQDDVLAATVFDQLAVGNRIVCADFAQLVFSGNYAGVWNSGRFFVVVVLSCRCGEVLAYSISPVLVCKFRLIPPFFKPVKYFRKYSGDQSSLPSTVTHSGFWFRPNVFFLLLSFKGQLLRWCILRDRCIPSLDLWRLLLHRGMCHI